MRAAIIDDLAPCRAEINACLTRYLNEHYAGECPVIVEFTSGKSFLSGFVPESWDIIFLDQYMEGLSGIDTAKRIRQTDRLVPLVFITTSDSHAVESYGVRACGYLVKPYAYSDFEKTMELAGIEKLRAARFIHIGREKILLREILWCDQDGHYLQIHTDGQGVLRFRLPFTAASGQLSAFAQFLPCYKSCIVNVERVDRIDGTAFVMDTGERVLFSAREQRKISKLYTERLFELARADALF